MLRTRTATAWRASASVLWLMASTLLAQGCRDRCHDTEGCARQGKCSSRGEVCLATEDSDCRASKGCELSGLCTARGECVAASDQDCQASVECKTYGKCVARNSMCCAKDGPCEKPRPRPPLPPGVKGEEGCPCGCDHSEQMARELAAKPSAEARAAISGALAAISEREDAGYITVAMVEHRLRLLALARERGLDVPVRPSPPRPVGDNPPVQLANARLRAQADLVVHGEHSEVVNGKEKLLRAAFRVHLELENLTGTPWTLARPVLHGDTPFPIERWYLLGSDGEPWDGSLGARASRSVYLVGYLSSDVTPGAQLQATLTLDGLTFELDARARRKWYGLTADEARPACQCGGSH